MVWWQLGRTAMITGFLFYLRGIGSLFSLVEPGKKWMFLIIQAENRNWNLDAGLTRKTVVQKAMRKSIKDSPQRKKENQRDDQKPMP